MTLFDRAEAYGPFSNDELLARAFEGKRDRVVIATKFGFKFDEKGAIARMDSIGALANTAKHSLVFLTDAAVGSIFVTPEATTIVKLRGKEIQQRALGALVAGGGVIVIVAVKQSNE